MEGNLQRWTGYLKGYQWRVFALRNGCLDYFRSTKDCQSNTNCRGSLPLRSCRIEPMGRCDLIVSCPGSQTYYLRATDEVDRQRWVNALELSRREAGRSADADSLADNKSETQNDGQDGDSDEDERVLNLERSLKFQLDEIDSCHQSLGQHVHGLQRELSALEISQLGVAKQLKPLFEKMMLLKMAAEATYKRNNDYLVLAKSQSQAWRTVVQRERQRRRRLEEAVETIARQHNVLEAAVKQTVVDDKADQDSTDGVLSRSIVATLDDDFDGRCRSATSISDEESEDIFMDCLEDTEQNAKVTSDVASQASASLEPSVAGDGDDWPVVVSSSTQRSSYRSTIPDRPDVPMNLWSILKNFIGQDLSRIAMPVMINEPLSFLQRLCEVDLEYSDLLDRAVAMEDSAEQMALVCAFAVASYSSTSYRIKKPFNPLLGETFEMDRTADLGWRCICEQVSHHPPESAIHAESKEWQFWEDYTMTTKFRGKYAQILPHGSAHLLFRKSGNHYTWNKPITTVHNVIVGKLWIDSSGDMAVVNHTTQDKCTVTFHEFSYFSKNPPRRVTGMVQDKAGLKLFKVAGTWDASISYSEVLPTGGQQKALQFGEPKLIWEARPVPSTHAAKYNFSEFTCSLNEEDATVAPTDSRHRPDQRVMEQGDFDEANKIKVLLEEKQRQRRKVREATIASLQAQGKDTSVAQYKPCYFRVEKDTLTGLSMHRYVGGYWEAKKRENWQNSVDLYTTK